MSAGGISVATQRKNRGRNTVVLNVLVVTIIDFLCFLNENIENEVCISIISNYLSPQHLASDSPLSN